MKLALTLEADSINAQTLNMGRIVVDVDGVNLTELINKVAENGYSLRVVDDSDQQSTCMTAYRKLLGKRYLMHVQSWGFQHRKQPPCCERERQIV
ncbi:MAG: hypothetical protein KHY68_11000 [Collinsella sp.]|nr:hypothetical protein [Collinsella sp.]